jgi:putative two-component system response regulator
MTDGGPAVGEATTPVVRPNGGVPVRRIRVGGREPRIVVLDDDDTNVLLLSRLLGRAGYEDVVTSTDPVATTAAILEDPPDLLLLDLRMPELDGYGVLERLAPLLAPPHELAVLVLTADLTTETRHRALAAGARDFVTKPFDLVELALRVGNLLETADLHRRLREQNDRLESAVGARTDELVRLSAELAHEVRTPLYAIRGVAEVLLDFEDGLPAALRGDIAQVDAFARLALELVDRGIASARAVAGSVLPAPAAVEVTDVLAGLRDVMGRTAGAVDGRLHVADGAGLPPIVTDAPRLGQVLRNLVADALGAAGEGQVRVSAELVDDGARMAFHVRRPEAVVAVPPSETGAAGAAEDHGMGLPIARRLARLLGGEVTVSDVGDGDSCLTATVATRLEVPPAVGTV